jgi:oxalate decarboxylase
MLKGRARVTAVDQNLCTYQDDVGEGEGWNFPAGIPHSIQGLADDGCEFLLVFDNGNFSEDETFLLTDWLAHTPREVIAKNFGVPESAFVNIPDKELYIFPSQVPGPLAQDRVAGLGPVPQTFTHRMITMEPIRMKYGQVRILDASKFPATTTTAALVEVEPGGLRELHWHPNADEWQYYVKGTARMTVFSAGAHARTMDFHPGDVGYIDQSLPHYVENIGDTDLVFLEVFPTPEYQDISLGEWLAHTPLRLVNEHIGTGEDFLAKIVKTEVVITPEK